MRYLFFALRPDQWSKNLFIFIPLIFGKKLFSFHSNLKTLAAFCIFSLAASAVYLINDISDLKKDRLHPIKRLRPLASGKITLAQAWITAFALTLLSVVCSFALNIYFGWVIVSYVVFNIAYSKVLKDLVIIDVFCLGWFFLLRVIAGTFVAEVEFSYWMIFMMVLLALFLGFNKRRQELKSYKMKAVAARFVLRKYDTYFIDQMIAVITSSIVVSYMLYTVDARTVREIGSNHLIYSIPFVYYGIFRYLYIVHKIGKGGDPTRILFIDKMLQVDIFLWLIVCGSVIYFKI